MPAPDIQFYDSTDTSIVTSVAFTGVTPGVASAATELHIWNDKGDVVSSDDAIDVILFTLGRIPPSGAFLADGLELLDQRSTEMRIIGFQGTAEGSTTGWMAVGAGIGFPMPDIPYDSAIEIEVRINAPASATEQDIDIALRVETRTYQQLEAGHWEALGNGITLFDGDYGAIKPYIVSDTVQNPGGADNKVEVQDLFYWVITYPRGKLKQLITFSNLDGAAAALAAGEEYWAALTLGFVVITTKGLKGTAPLPDSARPAVPKTNNVNQPVLAWVRVPFSAVITNSLIENDWDLNYFGWSSSALTFIVHPGTGVVDGAFVNHSSRFQVTLPASSTRKVFINRTGGLEITADNPPNNRSMALYSVTTDGSGVTAVVDLRTYLGEFAISLELNSGSPLAVGDYVTWTNPHNRDVQLRKDISSSVHDAGTGLTSGDYIFEIETHNNGGTWATLFQSSGTDDRRPTIAYDAWEDNSAFPEWVWVGANKSIRARVVAVPTGTTPAAGASVALNAKLLI